MPVDHQAASREQGRMDTVAPMMVIQAVVGTVMVTTATTAGKLTPHPVSGTIMGVAFKK